MPDSDPDATYTKRQYLLMKQLQRGVEWDDAVSNVDTILRAEDDHEPDERVMTFMQWEADRR